jgi:hypothetical protein
MLNEERNPQIENPLAGWEARLSKIVRQIYYRKNKAAYHTGVD